MQMNIASNPRHVPIRAERLAEIPGYCFPKKFTLWGSDLQLPLHVSSGGAVLVPGDAILRTMTDRSSSLTPAAMRQILSHIDEAIRLLDRAARRPTPQQLQTRSILKSVRTEVAGQLRSANGEDPPAST
jgi:hypothetical protein